MNTWRKVYFKSSCNLFSVILLSDKRSENLSLLISKTFTILIFHQLRKVYIYINLHLKFLCSQTDAWKDSNFHDALNFRLGLNYLHINLPKLKYKVLCLRAKVRMDAAEKSLKYSPTNVYSYRLSHAEPCMICSHVCIGLQPQEATLKVMAFFF